MSSPPNDFTRISNVGGDQRRKEMETLMHDLLAESTPQQSSLEELEELEELDQFALGQEQKQLLEKEKLKEMSSGSTRSLLTWDTTYARVYYSPTGLRLGPTRRQLRACNR